MHEAGAAGFSDIANLDILMWGSAGWRRRIQLVITLTNTSCGG